MKYEVHLKNVNIIKKLIYFSNLIKKAKPVYYIDSLHAERYISSSPYFLILMIMAYKNIMAYKIQYLRKFKYYIQ